MTRTILTNKVVWESERAMKAILIGCFLMVAVALAAWVVMGQFSVGADRANVSVNNSVRLPVN